jgi:Domain of unknown function (DUF5668)
VATQPRCHCQSCSIRSLTGPAVVITVGILFLLHQLRGGVFFFGHTWPIILVVIGAVQLASSLASREGHREPVPVAGVPPGTPPAPPVPPAGVSQPPYSPQGQ